MTESNNNRCRHPDDAVELFQDPQTEHWKGKCHNCLKELCLFEMIFPQLQHIHDAIVGQSNG